MNKNLLRNIPKIDVLLAAPVLRELASDYPYGLVRETAQAYTERLRTEILAGERKSVPGIDEIARQVAQKLERGDIFSLKRVINATGVVLHTNLGRAPLGKELAEHVAQLAAGYCNLEYDLDSGSRGSRYSHIEKLLCALTGAEAAMVVNNNAGAVFLMLNTLTNGQKVAVSRGELVEIGGSFRVPEIMNQSGVQLMEIGTTNKTHPSDYTKAIENGASALLKVHTSNFVMSGFTESVEIDQLGCIAREKGVLLLYDLGSGFLFPSENLGIQDLGHVAGKCLRSGADIVCFSGDKLLGSAQAGIILGRRELIDKIKKNHLTRMLRIDKLSLAALEMTLRYSGDPALAREKIPTLNMLAMTERECLLRARELEELIKASAPEIETHIVHTLDEPGGGSLPGLTLDGGAVAVTISGLSAGELEKRLRMRSVPVIARISRESLLLSVRTLCPGDTEDLSAALAEINKEAGK